MINHMKKNEKKYKLVYSTSISELSMILLKVIIFIFF